MAPPYEPAHAASCCFFNVEQIADLLQLSPKSVRRLIKRGELRAYRVGRQLRVSQEDLRAFLMQRRE